MGMKITLTLSDDQAIGLIRLAAAASTTIENQVLELIEVACFDADVMPALSLEEFLRDIAEPTRTPRALRPVE